MASLKASSVAGKDVRVLGAPPPWGQQPSDGRGARGTGREAGPGSALGVPSLEPLLGPAPFSGPS